MGDVTGFLKIKRKEAGNRSVYERICDYSEIEQVLNSEDRMLQSSRCMDCGVPFCHWSCPLGNLIPEWNDLLYRGDWKSAYHRLAVTNNFPEFTGRVCPAMCEHSCVLALNKEPVTIRENEAALAEKAFLEGYIKPNPPKKRTGKKVAVIGSGPAGLAAADILNKSGHLVTLFEKSEKPGGLLRFGIPDFKLSKATIDRRLDILIQEGLLIKTGVEIGKDISFTDILNNFDAVCIAIGCEQPRDLYIEGRELKGIHFAMDYLTAQNRVNTGLIKTGAITAEGKSVLVIGGGDTGSDCVGTAIRQRAKKITQIEILPKPPLERTPENPWPFYAKTLKTSTSHEEGCDRLWSLSSKKFTGNNGNVSGVIAKMVDIIYECGNMIIKERDDEELFIEADLVLIAMGFVNPYTDLLTSETGIALDTRKNINTNPNLMTNIKSVFACGDAVTGASLVVNAIASGRKAAEEINRFLA